MRIRLTSLLAVLLLLILATSGTGQDANTTATTTVSCCSLNVDSEHTTVDAGAITLVTVHLRWSDGTGAIVRTEDINISDGDPALAADDLLTGTGAGGTPLGYIRAVGETQAGETGSVSKRWKYRRLLWLKTNARLSNNAVTLQ